MEVITEERVERYRRVLGLEPDATLSQVQSAYRRGMRRSHPDLVGGDGERAKLLNEARDYLLEHPEAIRAPRVQAKPPGQEWARQPRSTRSEPRPPARVAVSTPTSPVAPMAVEERSIGWRALVVVLQLLRYLVIGYLGLFVFALLGWIATVAVPWFLTAVWPIIS